MKKLKVDIDNDFIWLQYGVDLQGRKIMIDEDIDEYSVGWAIRGIKVMEQRSDKPIEVFINSYGGSVYDGLALYDILTCSKCIIKCHAMGKIMSMGLIIYLAGDERYSLPYASFMNHGMSSASWGKLYEMKIELKECERLERIGLEILENQTFKDYKYWKKRSKYEDEYIEKTEAIKLGIVTHEYK